VLPPDYNVAPTTFQPVSGLVFPDLVSNHLSQQPQLQIVEMLRPPSSAGHHGSAWTTGNWIVAAYRHDTSRELDPQPEVYQNALAL
jgi:hypothetical protein